MKSNDATKPAPDTFLRRISSPPLDVVETRFGRARDVLPRLRLRHIGDEVKAAETEAGSVVGEYDRAAREVALREAERLAEDIERRTRAGLEDHGNAVGTLAQVETIRGDLARCGDELRAAMDAMCEEQEAALEQRKAVCAERTRRFNSFWKRARDTIFRRKVNRIAEREIEHASRGARVTLQLARYQAAENLLRDSVDRLDQTVERVRRLRDDAASAEAAADARRQAAASLLPRPTARTTPSPREAAELARPVCGDPERVRAMAQRVLRRGGEGSLSAILQEEALLEAGRINLPAGLEDALMALTDDRRAAHLVTLTTEAAPALPVNFLEAPMDERHLWRLMVLSGGERAAYHAELHALNDEQVTTFTLDGSLDEPDALSQIVYEMGIAAPQVPLLVQARMRTSIDDIKASTLWPDPGQLDEVDYELAAKRLDDEEGGWRRLSLGLVFGLLEIDSGRWCRTTTAAPLNGLSNRKIAQGVEPSVEVLRSGDMAAAIEVAIENRVATLGATQALAAIEAANSLPIPSEHSEKIRHILAEERQRLRREVLLT